MSNLFSIQGRLNRAPYFWIAFAITIAVYIIDLMIGLEIGASGGSPSDAAALGALVGIGGSVLMASRLSGGIMILTGQEHTIGFH
jgi:uncharacterized membrane protein YhaH (DUF805 family)